MIRLGRSFWWLLGIIGLSVLLTQIPSLSGNPVYLRLIISLGVILVANFLWMLFSLTGIEVKRSSRTTRKQVGEIFTENYEIINRSKLPKMLIKVTDRSELPGGAGSRVLTWMRGRQSKPYAAYTSLQKRGWIWLGPTEIESGDLFGLFRITKSISTDQRLLIMPYTVPIRQFPAPFGMLSGGQALRQKTLEVTSYAAGVREYVPGDPLRRIHWPSSARKQELIVKEFEKDPMAEVWIFLDARVSVHSHLEEVEDKKLKDLWWVKEKQAFHLPPYSEEYAISSAASISQYYINQKRKVGLVTSGLTYTILPPERGERQLGKILETLSVIKPEGDMPLWGLISSQLGHLVRGSTVILITPSSDDKLMTVVLELVQRGIMPVVILLDVASFGGQSSEKQLENQLFQKGIQSITIKAGDDLKVILENPKQVINGRLFNRN
ncbi:MAG: DUF58 domain-containing protein [Anaerolineaceae bacterium]|nr:DUF58 domain-containing protein [Anaerolineaceae bacterium]